MAIPLPPGAPPDAVPVALTDVPPFLARPWVGQIVAAWYEGATLVFRLDDGDEVSFAAGLQTYHGYLLGQGPRPF